MSRSIYYRHREAPQGGANFEVGYWGPVRDPDGVLRDPSLERDKKVEDLKDELAFVNGLPSGRILDVGCGLGHLLSGVDPRWERHGVEISEYAAERARAHGSILRGDLRSAGYPDAWFDVVTLYHVIEHMADPVAELREIRRVLKPGGAFVVGTPNFDSACARRFGERFRLLHDVTHISLFGAASLRALLEDEGFAVEREEFPFFDTRYFTRENLERLLDVSQMSPAFYGNIMTFYARRPERSALVDSAARAARVTWRILEEDAAAVEKARAVLASATSSDRAVWVSGRGAQRRAGLLSASGHAATALSGGQLPASAGAGDVLVVLAEGDAGALLAEAGGRGVVTIVLTDEALPPGGEALVVLSARSSARDVTERVHDALIASIAEGSGSREASSRAPNCRALDTRAPQSNV